MVEKKDWEKILKDNEDQKANMIRSYEMTLPQFDAVIALCRQKISEFKDADPMPEDLKKDLGGLVG